MAAVVAVLSQCSFPGDTPDRAEDGPLRFRMSTRGGRWARRLLLERLGAAARKRGV